MPRIGLDLLCLGGERTGMAAQAWWLARLMPGAAPDLDFVYFLPPGVESPAAGVEVVRVRHGDYRGARLVAEQWHLPRAAARARLDMLHTIAYGPPALHAGRKMLTIHDLGLWVLPDTGPARYRWYWRWAYERAAAGCAPIIAVSEATKRDVVRILHRRADDVAVVHCGVDPAYGPSPPDHDPAAALRAHSIPERYVLNVGTIQPRKDLVTLLDTFARLRKRHADLHLVIAGGTGWGYGDPQTIVERRGLAGAVTITGFLPARVMPDLYRNAQLLLFTSRYEGFGLPLLEAMACGTPVVATDTSSVPEVTGDAALLAPAGDATELAAAAGRLLEDGELRAGYRRRGLERAALFSWEKAARRTIEIYRSALAGAGR